MKRRAVALGLLSTVMAGTAFAAEGPVPRGIPHLNHVFLIMMENHGYNQILDNPNAPFINQLAKSANLATNYFGVGHPSLTNYLEVVGGSNFGVQTDNNPDWHDTGCVTNLASGITATDNPPSPAICPIWGVGTDAATPAVDTTNEAQGLPGENNIDGIQSIPAAADTVGMTIADQLVDWGQSWKSYQESLPSGGADLVNYSDGFFTDNTDFSQIQPALNPPLSQANVVALYAVKHVPFLYFRSVQEGNDPRNSLNNIVGFEGPRGLFADLRSGRVPAFSFIAPNQCNDQHGRGNAGADCTGAALMYRGDAMLRKLVQAIQASPSWGHGHNAIVVTWDENDYGVNEPNKVLTLVINNHRAPRVVDNTFYSHFSLLRTLEGGMGLPCLNHACDPGTAVMSPLFAGTRDRDQDRDHDRR